MPYRMLNESYPKTHGDGISLTSHIPAGSPRQGLSGDVAGMFLKRFGDGGGIKLFGNVSDVYMCHFYSLTSLLWKII